MTGEKLVQMKIMSPRLLEKHFFKWTAEKAELPGDVPGDKTLLSVIQNAALGAAPDSPVSEVLSIYATRSQS